VPDLKMDGGSRRSLRLRLLGSFVAVLTLPVLIALLFSDAPLRDELVIFGWSVLVGIVMASFTARLIARPIEQVTMAAERALTGDLAAPLPDSTSDEVGALTAAVEQMRDELARQRADAVISRDEVRESVKRLGEVLRSTHDLMKLLSVVLETALVAVRGGSGAVYLLSARRSELMIKVGRNMDRSVAEEKIAIGAGLAGWVAQHRKGVRVPNGVEIEMAAPEPSGRTALAVPLETQSQLLGVLAIYGRTDEETFNVEDLETIESLARQAGVGIENVLLHQEAERLSITDGLTGVWNHRWFQIQFKRDFEGAIRFKRDLSVLMIDIDDFKKVNDTCGHQRGDSILIELARRIVTHTRGDVDTVARYGGEEFALILPETPLDGARIVAEKICAEVSRTPFGDEGEEPIPVTVSIGYASYPAHGLTPQLLLHAADQAMYLAKTGGKNKIVDADQLNGSFASDPARS
jgi:two-component system, cell cycle response regulator